MYVRTAVGLGQSKREQIPEERLLRQVMENGLQFQAEIAGRVRDIKLSPGVARSPYLPKRHPESREYWALPRDERAKVAVTVNRIFKEATRIVRNLDPKDPKDKPWIRIWLTLRDIVMRVRAEEATPTGHTGPVQTWPNQPAPQRPGPVRPWPWPPRPPQPPQPPEPPVIDPGWRPPRLPLPDLSPKEILDRAKEVLEFLKRNNGDQSLIQKIENLLRKAAPIISLAGAVLGLYVFAKGRLVQMIAATGMVLPRILHRFEMSGMKEQLERILGELTDPKMTRAAEEEVRKAQRRGPTGKFEKKQPGDEPPGSQHERAVCELVRRRFPFFAEQVKIKRFAPRGSFPGQPPSPGLVLADPPVKVDCIGSMSPTSGLVLFEAKESDPPDFSNPGLTAGQRIVYPALVEYGGALVVSKGSFAAGTLLPSGTRIRIITPANLDDI